VAKKRKKEKEKAVEEEKGASPLKKKILPWR